jgi:hypothetical protein
MGGYWDHKRTLLTFHYGIQVVVFVENSGCLQHSRYVLEWENPLV